MKKVMFSTVLGITFIGCSKDDGPTKNVNPAYQVWGINLSHAIRAMGTMSIKKGQYADYKQRSFWEC